MHFGRSRPHDRRLRLCEQPLEGFRRRDRRRDDHAEYGVLHVWRKTRHALSPNRRSRPRGLRKRRRDSLAALVRGSLRERRQRLQQSRSGWHPIRVELDGLCPHDGATAPHDSPSRPSAGRSSPASTRPACWWRATPAPTAVPSGRSTIRMSPTGPGASRPTKRWPAFTRHRTTNPWRRRAGCHAHRRSR